MKRAEQFTLKLKITCTLEVKVINYVTPSYSPSNEIMVIDRAKCTECVLCFHAFRAFVHLILIIILVI